MDGISDKWGRRGPLVTIGVLLLWGFSVRSSPETLPSLFFYFFLKNNNSKLDSGADDKQNQLGNRLLVDSTNISSKFALLTLVILFTSNWRMFFLSFLFVPQYCSFPNFQFPFLSGCIVSNKHHFWSPPNL